jgi:ParE toxin of type II toxin-antitoxin system, parDE
MRAEFLAPAAAEFSEAVAYYESRREGLGSEFAAEVRRTIDRVLQYPDAWTPLSPRTRRCRTNRFPYGVIYQIRGDVLLVVAVMHLHRKPESWRARLRSSQAP